MKGLWGTFHSLQELKCNIIGSGEIEIKQDEKKRCGVNHACKLHSSIENFLLSEIHAWASAQKMQKL